MYTSYQAIALRLFAIGTITAMSALVRLLTETLPIGQIMVWRSAVALLPILAYLWWRGQLREGLRTRRPWAHVLRGGLGACAMMLSFLSLAYLSVAQATALAYLAPLMTLPLAVLMLGERLGAYKIVAAILGFLGVLLMLWTDLRQAELDPSIWVGIAAGVGFALTMSVLRVHMKEMTRSEPPAAIAFYFAVMATLVGAVMSLWAWVPIGFDLLPLLVLTGLLGAAAHIAGAEAVARAPVSTLAPFEYTGMLFALGLDLLIFGLLPGWIGVLGAALILLAAAVTLRADVRPQAADQPAR